MTKKYAENENMICNVQGKDFKDKLTQIAMKIAEDMNEEPPTKELVELLDPSKNREFWDEANWELAHLMDVGHDHHEHYFCENYKGYDNEDLAGALEDFPYSFIVLLQKHGFQLKVGNKFETLRSWNLKQICLCKTEQQYRNCDNFECIRFKEGR